MPHIHEKIDFTAEAFIINDGAVLLRKHDKYKIWLSVGGHIELDEDPNQAVVREAKEEIGLDITILGHAPKFISEKGFDGYEGYKELIPPPFMNRHRINSNHEHVTFIYFAISKSRNISQGSAEISEECRWFTEAELDDKQYDIRESIKFYAKSALGAARKSE